MPRPVWPPRRPAFTHQLSRGSAVNTMAYRFSFITRLTTAASACCINMPPSWLVILILSVVLSLLLLLWLRLPQRTQPPVVVGHRGRCCCCRVLYLTIGCNRAHWAPSDLIYLMACCFVIQFQIGLRAVPRLSGPAARLSSGLQPGRRQLGPRRCVGRLFAPVGRHAARAGVNWIVSMDAS